MQGERFVGVSSGRPGSRSTAGGKDSRCERSGVEPCPRRSRSRRPRHSVGSACRQRARRLGIRVEPIAREVEKLRGLEFEHPVPVDFLSEPRSRRTSRSTANKLSADDKKEIARAQSQLRSIGLLADDVDLIDALSSLRRPARSPSTTRRRSGSPCAARSSTAPRRSRSRTSSRTRCRISTSTWASSNRPPTAIMRLTR